MGAADDRLITPAEVEATARAYQTQAEVLPGMAHDMMLEAGWQAVADPILTWLEAPFAGPEVSPFMMLREGMISLGAARTTVASMPRGSNTFSSIHSGNG